VTAATTVVGTERQRPGVTLAVLSIAGISFGLLQSLVAPALPDLQHDLHTSQAGVAWILTAYLLSASVATPIIGRLGDIHGKEHVLMIVLGILAAGALVSALAHSLSVMIVGRIIQGAGGGVFPLSFAIIRDEFPADRVSGGIGLMSSLMGIGGGAGVILAGPIIAHLGFHWIFWIPLVFVLVAALLTHLFVPESPIKAPAKVNYKAAALMSAGLAAILLAVSQAEKWGWGSAKMLGLIAIGALVCMAWVRVELRARDPLVDMRMMRLRGVWTTNLVAALFGIGMYASFVLIPTLVQEPKITGYGFGSSITEAGLFLVPSTVMMLIVGQLAGPLERRFGSKPPLLAGAACSIACYTMLAVAHDEAWQIYVASALLGLGIGLAFAAMANLIVVAVRPEQTGVATGMNTVTRTVGGAFGSQVVASILAASAIGGHPTEHAFVVAFGVCAVALIIGLLVGLLIPQRRSV